MMMRKFLSKSVVAAAAFAPSAQLQRRWKGTNEHPVPEAEAEAEDKADKATKETVCAILHEKISRDLVDATQKIKDLNKDYLYVLAEAENARRISRQDVEKARDYGISSFSKDMLEVADILEKAVESFEKLPATVLADKQVGACLTGVKLTGSVLSKNLSKHGVEPLVVKRGDAFNPNEHEALFQAPATPDCPVDHVAAVVKTGYRLKERVIRAAQVGVASE